MDTDSTRDDLRDDVTLPRGGASELVLTRTPRFFDNIQGLNGGHHASGFAPPAVSSFGRRVLCKIVCTPRHSESGALVLQHEHQASVDTPSNPAVSALRISKPCMCLPCIQSNKQAGFNDASLPHCLSCPPMAQVTNH